MFTCLVVTLQKMNLDNFRENMINPCGTEYVLGYCLITSTGTISTQLPQFI